MNTDVNVKEIERTLNAYKDVHEVAFRLFNVGAIRQLFNKLAEQHEATRVMSETAGSLSQQVSGLQEEVERLNAVLEQIEHDTEDEQTAAYARHNRLQSIKGE